MSAFSIDIASTGLGTVLNQNALKVPMHQRSYAWGEEHIQELFDDVIHAMLQDETSEYFLGSMVLRSGEGAPPEILDGQQRLATISMLLSAISDYFHEMGDTERAELIKERFLRTKTLENPHEPTPRLKLNKGDNDFFQRLVVSDLSEQEKKNVKPLSSSQDRIADGFAQSKKFIKELVAPYNDGKVALEVLLKLVRFIELKAIVILVKVPGKDQENAFRIFETLNDRGLPLTLSDLLKNYLFEMSGEQIDEIEKKWDNMAYLLETIGDDSVVVKYIYYLWTSLYGHTKERDLFGVIKKQITSKGRAIEFTNTLSREATIYTALFNSNNAYWNDFSDTAKFNVYILQLLRKEQMRPLQLAVLRNFEKKEAEKSLAMMVNWAVRFQVTGKVGGWRLYQEFSTIALQVQDKKIKTTEELIKEISSSIPDDESFEYAFSQMKVFKSDIARYFLRMLEQDEDQPEYIANPKSDEINLEHILPQHPSEDWKHSFDEEKAKQFAHRLGNMVLLKEKVNKSVSNSGFDRKKILLAKSSLKLTSEVGQKNQWTQKEIEERQNKLAEKAVAVWPTGK